MDAQDYWRIFQRKLETLKTDSPATTETRNLWMVPLLGLLGYQLEYQPKAAELNGKTYVISHCVVNRACLLTAWCRNISTYMRNRKGHP